MRDIWVISDTHFGHANILTFRDKDDKHFRGDLFANVQEMNEAMVDNWNSVVKDGDYVYHLGDVFFGPKSEFESLWSRLKGSKRLIVGNHDNIIYFAKGGFFKKIEMWRMWSDMGLLFTHVPIDPSGLWRGVPEGMDSRRMLNVHGHIHQNPSPTEHHRCVCVEHINYTPIHIEELRQW